MIKIKKYKVITEYFREEDVMCINWGKVDNSRELFEDKILVDFDKKGDVVGLEINDFTKELRKSQKKINKILNSNI